MKFSNTFFLLIQRKLNYFSCSMLAPQSSLPHHYPAHQQHHLNTQIHGHNPSSYAQQAYTQQHQYGMQTQPGAAATHPSSTPSASTNASSAAATPNASASQSSSQVSDDNSNSKGGRGGKSQAASGSNYSSPWQTPGPAPYSGVGPIPDVPSSFVHASAASYQPPQSHTSQGYNNPPQYYSNHYGTGGAPGYGTATPQHQQRGRGYVPR